MSLGTPVNWSAPTASPASQPESFRYQGESYVRMGNGQILTHENFMSQARDRNLQSMIDTANNYDPSEATRRAQRAMESQPYISPTTKQPVSREQFFNEHSRIQRQASNQYDAAMRQRMANAGTAWDTPLPRGVTVDMLPTGNGAFAPAPTAGAIVPSRRGAPVGEALRQPINMGVKPRAQPLLNQQAASQAIAGGAAAGGFAAYAAYSGGAGFFEGAGAGIGGWVGGAVGGGVGGAIGGAALGGAGTFAFPVVGTVSGATVGAGIGGGIGLGIGSGLGSAAGQGLGRAIDNLIPDFFRPPNELDPSAMDAGATITPGTPPPFTGGQLAVQYTVLWTRSYGDPNQRYDYLTGPLSFSREGTGSVDCGPGGGTYNVYTIKSPSLDINLASGCGETATNIRVERRDGLPDTGGDPPGAIEPVRALNPARQTSTPTTPRTLPPPLPTPAETDLPWPETPAQETPDTTPLTPPAPAPNFNPTQTGEPTTSTEPNPNPDPTDLDSPRETPPNLGDDPLTPPVVDPLTPVDESKPTGWLVNGKPSKIWGSGAPIVRVNGEVQDSGQRPAINGTTATLAVAIPVVLLEGLRQKVNTPTGSLTNRTQPNPNVQITKPPPVQTTTAPNPPTCIYERQRVMDIQNKATDVQEKASNPVSGFPGLYGIGIESRVKLGQTFNLLEGVNQFMRKAWETTRIQKAINALTLVTTLHNAYYLSRDVGSTLGEMISLLLDTVGIDDEAGNPLDINTMVGNKVKAAINAALGERLATNIGNSLTKASRIYQSASNVIWSIRNITDSTTDLLEITANNTGKIGNSLRESKVVDALTMPRFSENYRAGDATRRKTQRILDGIEQVDDTVGTLYAAVATVRDVQEEVTAAGQAKDKLIEDVRTLAPREDVPENEPVATANDEANAASQAPNAQPVDLEPADGTP